MEGTIGGVSNVSLPSHADACAPLPGIDFELSASVPGASQQNSGSRARPTQQMEGGE